MSREPIAYKASSYDGPLLWLRDIHSLEQSSRYHVLVCTIAYMS